MWLRAEYDRDDVICGCKEVSNRVWLRDSALEFTCSERSQGGLKQGVVARVSSWGADHPEVARRSQTGCGCEDVALLSVEKQSQGGLKQGVVASMWSGLVRVILVARRSQTGCGCEGPLRYIREWGGIQDIFSMKGRQRGSNKNSRSIGS